MVILQYVVVPISSTYFIVKLGRRNYTTEEKGLIK